MGICLAIYPPCWVVNKDYWHRCKTSNEQNQWCRDTNLWRVEFFSPFWSPIHIIKILLQIDTISQQKKKKNINAPGPACSNKIDPGPQLQQPQLENTRSALVRVEWPFPLKKWKLLFPLRINQLNSKKTVRWLTPFLPSIVMFKTACHVLPEILAFALKYRRIQSGTRKLLT